MAETTCPIFRPTAEEFEDFSSYVQKIETKHPDMGLCKIIPPEGWFVCDYDLDNIKLKITNPLQQIPNGQDGVYKFDLVQNRTMNLQQFRKYCEKNKYENPDYAERERKYWKSLNGSFGSAPLYGADLSGSLFPTHIQPITTTQDNPPDNTNEPILTSHNNPQDSNTEMLNLDDIMTESNVFTDELFPQTNNETTTLLPSISISEQQPEPQPEQPSEQQPDQPSAQSTEPQLEQSESQPQPSNDPLQDLYQRMNANWNLNTLSNNVIYSLGMDMGGVNSPMLYIGSWRATFAYHVEDLDLYSINYLHIGEPKSWYSVPLSARNQFEAMCQHYFLSDYKACHEFLRHKRYHFSPTCLQRHGIPFTTAVQHPGEFIITFPGAYHAGFNHGFNIAEAINFILPRWFPMGKIAKPCLCLPGNVQIDVDMLETLFLREKFANRYYQALNTEILVPSDKCRIRCLCIEKQEEAMKKETKRHRKEHVNIQNNNNKYNNWDYSTTEKSDGDSNKNNKNNNVVALKEPLESNLLPAIVDWPLIQCEGCFLYYHSHCLDMEKTFQLSKLVYYQYDLTISLCHLCQYIEYMALHAQDIYKLSQLTFKYEKKLTSSMKTSEDHPEKETEKETEKEIKKEQEIESTNTTDKRKRKKPIQKPLFKVNDWVKLSDPMHPPIVGILTSISLDFGRLHIKGLPKELDRWIRLENCEIVLPNTILDVQDSKQPVDPDCIIVTNNNSDQLMSSIAKLQKKPSNYIPRKRTRRSELPTTTIETREVTKHILEEVNNQFAVLENQMIPQPEPQPEPSNDQEIPSDIFDIELSASILTPKTELTKDQENNANDLEFQQQVDSFNDQGKPLEVDPKPEANPDTCHSYLPFNSSELHESSISNQKIIV